MIAVLGLFVGVAVLLWPEAYRSGRGWRDGTLHPDDDPLSTDLRRRSKVLVVGTVVVSLILAIALIGMAMTEWL